MKTQQDDRISKKKIQNIALCQPSLVGSAPIVWALGRRFDPGPGWKIIKIAAYPIANFELTDLKSNVAMI